MLDTKWASVDGEHLELMPMRYKRILPVLLGAAKALTTRVAKLESRVQ